MYDLDRFLTAQRRDYAAALREIQNGRKRSHWIWYIFPQVAGLGMSSTSQYYAISGLDEARAYLREPTLREETGITARELIPLGPFYPAAAYSDEVIWMYLARGLTFGEQQLDDDEFLNLQAVPLDELARDVLAGRIPDAKTQAAILRVYCMEHGFEPK